MIDIFDLDHENCLLRCSELASIVWDNAFLSGLRKFNKSELIYLISHLTQRFNEKTIPIYSDLDLKDTCFSDKCTIIETLQEDFFKNKKECD